MIVAGSVMPGNSVARAGAAWVIQPAPNAPGADSSFLNGVSTLPGTARALAEHWDGSRWQLLTVPRPTDQSGAARTLAERG